MRIVYLSQYFPPEMGAPAARVYELSREWAKLGHDITVLTGFPNHPTGVIPPEYRGRWTRTEWMDGIRIVRAPIYATANRGRVRRSLSYLSFATSSAALGSALVQRPDVLIATSPQLLTGVAGVALAYRWRVPFVFEIRDLWPESVVEVGALKRGSLVVRGLETLERALYAAADHLVVVTDSFVGALEQRGVPRAKISVVKNGVDLELFQPRAKDLGLRKELGIGPDDFMALYVGTHGMAHGLDTLLEAARLLKDNPRMRVVLVGEGADKAALKATAERLQLSSVRFVDKQSRERIASFLAASDASVVLLKKRELFKTVLPSKVFEIMAAARPIVLGVEGEAKDLVIERAKAGVFIPPEDPAALAQALEQLASHPEERAQLGQNGRLFVEAHFSRQALAAQYLEVLQKLDVARTP